MSDEIKFAALARRWDRLAIRQQSRVIFVPIDQIDWVESHGNYVRLHIGGETHIHRETMQGMEDRLTEKNFLRISRCVLVNMERVREWQPMFRGDSVLILQDGQQLAATRAYRDRLAALLDPTWV